MRRALLLAVGIAALGGCLGGCLAHRVVVGAARFEDEPRPRATPAPARGTENQAAAPLTGRQAGFRAARRSGGST
jgi:hypothetical protein